MSDLDQMMMALRESQTTTTKLEAGQVLAEGGWSVFPLPNLMKFDRGLSYLNSTIDAGVFTSMAEDLMGRHECRDINIALVPARCLVPLLVLDLDGAESIESFRQEAWGRGHADLGLWLRVHTTRPDDGRHAYFTAPEGAGYNNSLHKWGGEVRSAKGHVVLPPSTTEHGKYAWKGELLGEAPDWVLEGLHRSSAPSSSGRGKHLSDSEMDELIKKLSTWETTAYGRAGLDALLQEMRDSMRRAGQATQGRNGTLARVVNRAMDLALDQSLNAGDAIDEIFNTYLALFSFDEIRERAPGSEVVRCVRSWTRNKEGIEEVIRHRDAANRWAQKFDPIQIADTARVAADELRQMLRSQS